MTGFRPRRSALYMPASNARAIEKARSLAVDAVILDLEDAVPAERKEEARQCAVEAVSQGGFGERELVIRINALDTPWGEADMAAAAAIGPDAILVPKIAKAADILACQAHLDRLGSKAALWGMIETCAAIVDLSEIARCARGSALDCLVMGTNDLAKEIGVAPDPMAPVLQPALAMAVIAARANGLAVLDGVTNQFDNAPAFAESCRVGAAFGFDGKTLIHPRQIDACNAAFSPSAEAVALARDIVAAFERPENQGKGAIRHGGAMIELLHLEQARRTLAIAADMPTAPA